MLEETLVRRQKATGVRKPSQPDDHDYIRRVQQKTVSQVFDTKAAVQDDSNFVRRMQSKLAVEVSRSGHSSKSERAEKLLEEGELIRRFLPKAIAEADGFEMARAAGEMSAIATEMKLLEDSMVGLRNESVAARQIPTGSALVPAKWSPSVRMVANVSGTGPLTVAIPRVADNLKQYENAGERKWLKAPPPFIATQYKCKNLTNLGGTPHHVCLDNWESLRRKHADRPCVVYDLGVRAQPQFSKTFVDVYGCVIRAYDPSEAAARWWGSNHTDAQLLKAATDEKYKFHSVAAGAADGPTVLFAHNSQPVSTSHPEHKLEKINLLESGAMPTLNVEAKTLSTMMADNGDTWMDVLKVDVEGAEYKFLQNTFERIGCPPAEQITIEFHHVLREKSQGAIHTANDLLNACGYKSFLVQDNWRNSMTPNVAPTKEKENDFCLQAKRYTLVSYCKGCREDKDL
jgi:FkbM family methyltransferase